MVNQNLIHSLDEDIERQLDSAFSDFSSDLGDILLPRAEVPPRALLGSKVEVFLYRDSQDRPIATTKRPKALPGEFALLKVAQSTSVGTFLDWGLQKDLLLPFSEQKESCLPGRSYIVYVYVDKISNRIIASRRLSKFFERDPHFEGQQKVSLLIYGKGDRGYSAIIDQRARGFLYHDNTSRQLQLGELTTGYIYQLRADGKIDLTLHPPVHSQVDELTEEILTRLRENNGHLPYHDRTDPEVIAEEFGVSKKAFKRALSSLYREKLITMNDDSISLN